MSEKISVNRANKTIKNLLPGNVKRGIIFEFGSPFIFAPVDDFMRMIYDRPRGFYYDETDKILYYNGPCSRYKGDPDWSLKIELEGYPD